MCGIEAFIRSLNSSHILVIDSLLHLYILASNKRPMYACQSTIFILFSFIHIHFYLLNLYNLLSWFWNFEDKSVQKHNIRLPFVVLIIELDQGLSSNSYCFINSNNNLSSNNSSGNLCLIYNSSLYQEELLTDIWSSSSDTTSSTSDIFLSSA